MINKKIMEWRSSPLHRRCKFCKWCYYYGGWYYCQAKDKIINDCLPNMTEAPRLFCKLYEVKEVDI